MWRLGACVAACVVCVPLGAQTARLTSSPARPLRGAIIQLSLKEESFQSDSIVSIQGWMAGEPLHFVPTSRRTWHAIGGIPVDAPDSVTARVVMELSSNRIDTVRVRIRLPPLRVSASRLLAVAPRFTRPLDAETEARVARENERARDVGRQSHARSILWTQSFLRPRASSITSRFGSGRLFNGKVTSRHLGVDFRGAIGEPVYAANRGVVALADAFFLAGNVVYIDHGRGVVTGYFHLSRTTVMAGDTVERGQKIGLVGATGRVTGPHLHWSARYGVLAVNPLDLLVLDSRLYGAAANGQPAPADKRMKQGDASPR